MGKKTILIIAIIIFLGPVFMKRQNIWCWITQGKGVACVEDITHRDILADPQP